MSSRIHGYPNVRFRDRGAVYSDSRTQRDRAQHRDARDARPADILQEYIEGFITREECEKQLLNNGVRPEMIEKYLRDADYVKSRM